MSANGELFKSFIDKIILGVLATAVTTYLFFGYNAYTKAFENIATQTQQDLKLALKLRGLVIDNASKVRLEIKASFSLGDPLLKKANYDKAKTVADDIHNDAGILSSLLPNSSKAADEIAVYIKNQAYVFNDTGFPVYDEFAKFERGLSDLQREFLSVFNAEIGPATSREFGQLFQSFYATMPEEYQPKNVIRWAILVVSGLALALFVWFNWPSRQKTHYQYIAVIKKDINGYVASFPDLKSVAASGATLHATTKNAAAALAYAAANWKDLNGSEFPKPRDLDQILSEPNTKETIVNTIAIPILLRSAGATDF